VTTTITPRYGAVGKHTSEIRFDRETGEPLNNWVRKDADGKWYEPPSEVQPMLDLLKPQLLWAPLAGEFRLELVASTAGIRIYLKATATIEEWKRALCALAEWKRL
jgi:hypothetical protein